MTFKQRYAREGRCRSTKRTPNSYEGEREREGEVERSKGGFAQRGGKRSTAPGKKGQEKKKKGKKKIPLRSDIPVAIARRVFRGQVHAVRIFGVIFARGSA